MWSICDELCFKSKNLYNYANYMIRQEFVNNDKWIRYPNSSKILKHSEPFKALGSNSSQMILRLLDKNWKSFFEGMKGWKKNPSKYLGMPKIPKYQKKDGRYICILTNMQSQIKNGYLYFAFKDLKPFNNTIRTKIEGKHLQTRIIPLGGSYRLEVVYEKEIECIVENKSKRIMGIDLGVNNFATISNNIGIKPIIINGRGIKSYNKYWNKQVAKYKSILKTNNKLDWSNRLQRITEKRNNKMDYFMHCVSRLIIDYCVLNNIDTLIIGYNDRWKQNCNINSNQTFIQIPYLDFINKLRYKCEENNIIFITNSESYTSGTSFLDNEKPTKDSYDKSRRIHRGLFKANDGNLINADLNASYQIIKKVFPNAFTNGIEGVHFHPVVINYNDYKMTLKLLNEVFYYKLKEELINEKFIFLWT